MKSFIEEYIMTFTILSVISLLASTLISASHQASRPETLSQLRAQLKNESLFDPIKRYSITNAIELLENKVIEINWGKVSEETWGVVNTKIKTVKTIEIDQETFRELLECGIFSETAFGEKIYKLLAISREKQKAIFEEICTFFLHRWLWSQENLEEWDTLPVNIIPIAPALLQDVSRINEQAYSGKTVLMLVASLLHRDFSSDARIFQLNRYRKEPRYLEEVARTKIIHLCETLIKNGAKVNIQDKNGNTCLHEAARNLFPPLCELLILYGGDVGKRAVNGETPFTLIIPKEAAAIRKWPSATVSASCDSFRREETCRMLRGYGARIDEKGSGGNTLLHNAAHRGERRILNLLLDKGADKNILNDDGQTPLHLASMRDERLVIEYLLMFKARQTIKDRFGNFPYHYYSAVGELRIYEEYSPEFVERNSSGWTPLHLACYFGNDSGVDWLLQKEVDINSTLRTSNKTPLMIACEKGFLRICTKFLAQSNLNRDARDDLVGSPLDWACEFGHYDVCKELLKTNFSNQTIKHKLLLLRRACHNNFGRILDLFFDTWRQWDIQDEAGNTALHIACINGDDEVVSKLLSNVSAKNLGADLKNKKGLSARACAEKTNQQAILVMLQNTTL